MRLIKILMNQSVRFFRWGNIILISLLFSYCIHAQTTYYVKSGGNNNADGLSDLTAWETLSKVNSRTFSPGDSILFKKGDIWRETLTIPSSGTAGNYIVFTNYGSGANPQILGSTQAIAWTNTNGNIWQSSTAVSNPYNIFCEIFFVELDGSVTWGAHKTYTSNFSNLISEHNWTWNGNTVYVYAESDPDERYTKIEVPQRERIIAMNSKQYIEINGIDLHYTQAGVQEVYPTGNLSGFIFRNSEIAYLGTKDNYGYGTTVCYNNSLFEYNTIHDCGRRGISFINYGSSDISIAVIQNNTFYNGFHTTGVDIETGGASTASGDLDSVIVRNCIMYDIENRPSSDGHSELIFIQGPHGGSGKVFGVYLYNNILKHTSMAGIHLENVSESYIYNNTFYGHNNTIIGNTFHVFYTTGCVNASLKNNIFYTLLNYETGGSGLCVYEDNTQDHTKIDADYNLYYRTNNSFRIVIANGNNYYRTTTSFNSLRSVIGWEIHSPTPADPLFVSSADLTLQSGSPAIGAGIDIPGYTTDFNGNPVGSPPDIGAFQGVGLPNGDLTPGSIGAAQSVCYNTAPAPLTQLTAPTGGTGTYTYQWQSSPDNSAWTDITGATLSGYSPPALSANTYFRRTVSSGLYTPVSSSSVLIIVYADLTPGSIGTAQSICYNVAPAPLTQITTPTGGTGTYTYQWESSANNSTWTNITGATAEGYSPPALTSNTYYRRRVTSGSCETVNSASILITMSSQITLAQLHDNISIANNTSTYFNIAIAGGTSPFTVNYTRNGVPQSTINNYSSGTDISTGILTTGVYTYALTSVTDTIGCTAQSLGSDITVTVTENGNLAPGSIEAAQSVCYNTAPASLTQVTAPTGGTGTYTYQWQSSPDNSAWTNITGATLSDYSPPALSVNTYFRRTVTSGSYIPVNSSSVLITVYANLTPGSIGIAQSVCYNTAPATLTQLNAPAGEGTYTFHWQSSPDNTSWSDIPGATAADYSPSALTSNTYYRRSVTTESCGTVNSASILVTVYADLTPGSIGSVQSVCYNTAPATLTQLSAPTGGTGTYTYQWQSSVNNSTWTNEAGATAAGYSPPALTSNTYYRRRVTSGSCGTINSASILITIYPQITLAQLHDDISIGNNTYTYFNIAISGGTSPFTVNYTRNGVPQSTINNYSSGTDISTDILTTGFYTYVLTSVTDKDGCAAQSLGTNITVTVIEGDNMAPGSIGAAQSVCYNTAPAPLTELTNPTGGTGTYTYQWQSSPNNSAWTDIPGATLSGYSPPALSANTYFRRTVTSSTYIPVNSSPVLITVYPQVNLAQLYDDISIIENTSTNFYIVISGGTSPFTVNYTSNRAAQPTIDNYSSGTDISTGVLTAGVYHYALISVTDANGCEAQSLGTNITVVVTGLISGVPNVFTPNGDGINETWAIPSIHNFPDAIIRVYDRNLKQIIQYTGLDPEWDGRDSNGTPLPTGSYLYVIELNNGTRPIKGYISLVK